MNTRRKIALTFAAASGVSLFCYAAVFLLYQKGTIPVWVTLVVIALSPLEMIPVHLFARRFRKRYDEAKSRGCTLCSRCEYEIPETQEKVACPECGVVRSAKEHQEVLESWNLWKT
jgi:uncharacterized paraquat-inducible protein A